MSERNCCPKCGRKLEPSDVDGYKFVCFNCDENFYSFEAVEEPKRTAFADASETGYRCPKCGNTESFDASCVVLIGTTHITPDGWDYYSYPNDVMLDSGASLTCCECGYEHTPEKFYE